MKKRVIGTIVLSIICVACLAISFILPKASVLASGESQIVESQQIMLLRSNYNFSQEQKLSQIKAEYLIENNGYKADDEIVVIISVDGESIIDKYSNSGYNTVASYLASDEGKAEVSSIENAQNNVVDYLKSNSLISEVLYHYTTIMNAVAVKTTYGKMNSIEGATGVSNVMMSETYNLPQSTESGDGSTVINDVDIYETGIYNSYNEQGYTGKNTAVAILDSGFDLSHEVFNRVLNDDEVLFSKDYIAECLSSTNAIGFTPSLELYNVYYSNKIPYVYDYADKDYDVFPYDSEHGTHVAGIIGGNSDTITGIAIDTQLVLMKVFPDLDEGGKTEDILAALEDCVVLGVDAINMSLGSSCGFSREEDNEQLNKVYEAIGKAGISLITAASNDYSSAFGGDQGNMNKVTNPDSGTVGSPSTYSSSLSVASISGTKSRYIICNDSKVLFYKESNSISGDENDFYAELYTALLNNGYSAEQLQSDITLEYVTIPGVGLSANFTGVDVKGKIALIKRGNNTFEEKAANAKKAGAIACIIYNNIDGDILMSMGKSDHIPTVSISKDDGYELAKVSKGTMKFNFNGTSESGGYLAGPFMSDFSSWGPTPSLEMKPEITAHGGNILSSVPNGGYEELSGTSMATPNLCGIIVIIREYLKALYPTYTYSQINNMANQMLMSTATIIRNEEGNPYSPRKQGAGLASLSNVLNTHAYLTVDGIDRTKLELGDDKDRTGVYTMTFNVVNISDVALSYDISLVGMTESVATSDSSFVSETPQLLSDNFTAEFVSGSGTLNGKKVTVNANGSVQVKITYTLSDSDKALIDSLFPYGMYVEGFVKLTAENTDEINLNIPFLAFYGDWTEAPMFDITYYEVEAEAHDNSIDDEDKIKADYIATTPYGSYYYNYIIPLGTYLYDIDETMYDAIPASEDHIAVSSMLGTIDGIGAIYTGLLRSAKTMTYTITDKATGEVIYENVEYNCAKAHYNSMAYPYYSDLQFKSYTNGLVNNREYEFSMVGKLDYGDGGVETNVRNSFSFTFTMDDEAPIIKSAVYEKEYDKTLKKDRYYITLTVYDNQYVQSIAPVIFTSSSTYNYLTENPIPVYSEKGSDTVVRFEITDYLEDIYYDGIITSALAFYIDDYALNSNLFLCQLPGTDGSFKFTTNGESDGSDLIILSTYTDDIVDLTNYLSTTDEDVDEGKDYLKHLVWTSSNEDIVEVQEGQIRGIREGKATITVREQLDGRQAIIIINVKQAPENESDRTISTPTVTNIENSSIESVRFAYYDTIFAYSRAAQTSEIGTTDSRNFVSASNGVSFYPGEKIKLYFDVNPWYVQSKYDFTYSSTNPSVASVDEDGVVTGLKEGTTTIVLSVSNSNIRARIKVTIKSEFVIENRTLVAYKGLGGAVVIPDDEGILYIGSYAFCLYTTDMSIKLEDDDYDANKIPSANTTITSIVIPEGVEDIQKYAFYNCSGLKTVVIPTTLKYIRQYAFYGDSDLATIVTSDSVVKSSDSESASYLQDASIKEKDGYLIKSGDLIVKENANKSLSGTKLEVIGANAFKDCSSLDNIDISKVYAIGVGAFANCTSLSYVDLTCLRNTGSRAFYGCTSLESITNNKNTKLSFGMFAASGLKSIVLDNTDCDIPDYCFAYCDKLESVTINGNIVQLGQGAFYECSSLVDVALNGSVDIIGQDAFYNCTSLETITLPNNNVTIKNSAFMGCEKLATVVFQANTKLATDDIVITIDIVNAQQNQERTNINGYAFSNTSITNFVVDANNANYSVSADGKLLLDKSGTKIVLVATGNNFGEYTLDEQYTTIGEGAFSGANITKLTITNKNAVIGAYAFANCTTLAEVVLPSDSGVTVGNYAFTNDSSLTSVVNMDGAMVIGNYAFVGTAITNAEIGANTIVGEGAFLNTKITSATIGENAVFGLGAFQGCKKLATVTMPENGGVHFGKGCFANDSLLSTIDLSKVGERIEAETFYGCTSLTKAELTNVKYIGGYAFADCSSVVTLTMPIVEEIGEGAFSRYSTYGGAPIFTSLVLPSTLTTIGDGAFLGCEYLTSIAIPESVSDIGDYTFAYCKKLKTVSLPSTVSEIGSYTFAGCELLTKINLENIKEFGSYAFTSSTELANISLTNAEKIGFGAFASTSITGNIVASKLCVIGDYAFQGCDITSFSALKVEYIGIAAFQGNANMTQYTFGKPIGYVGTMAFQGCSKLQSFYYSYGTQKTNNGIINNYAKLVKGVLYTMLDNGKYQLASVPSALSDSVLTVASNTYRIDFYAGNDNKNVVALILPDGLKYIGNYAFYGYTSLKTVAFNSVEAPVLEDNYDGDIALPSTAPQYDLFHNQYDLFGLELYYCNFINMVGNTEPITMELPSNSNVTGYDSVVYLAYFGKASESEKTTYTAMEQTMVDFINYANAIANLESVNISHSDLVSNAVASYNAITQDPTDYNIGRAEWDNMVEIVMTANKTLSSMHLRTASKKAQQIQQILDSLPTTFKSTMLVDIGTNVVVDGYEDNAQFSLSDLATAINSLEVEEKAYLDLTNYDALVKSYNDYVKSVNSEASTYSTKATANAYVIWSVAMCGLALGLVAVKKFW